MTVAELRADALVVATGDGAALGPFDVIARAGEAVGLRGPSASGKTTLLYALGGLEAPASGRLLADGRDVVPWRELTTAIVFQNLCLVPTLTAQETVALPLQAARTPPAQTRERAVAALERLGLADHVGQLVGTLSGGQRQRVAVARCLAAWPALVLADEPTSALDEHWRAIVLGALHELAREGAIVVLASGDGEVTAGCDRIVELDPQAEV